MGLTYTETHWGTRPSGTTDIKVATGRATPIGSLRAISYVTQKGDEHAVYRHEFTQFDGRGPYLLKGAKNGKYVISDDIPPLISVGRVIDFELENGRRILTSGLWVCHDASGDQIWLASHNGVPLGIEERSRGPKMTEHGIED